MSNPVPVTKVRNPADVVAIVPYLLGFQPTDSIVVVSLQGSRNRLGPCARLDLVDELGDVPHEVDYLAGIVEQHRFRRVVLVAYSERVDLVEVLMHELIGRLSADGVTVVEAVRADGTRWWSYVCDDHTCCPSDGTAYDPSTSRVAVEAVAAGLSRASSRDALRSVFDPRPDLQARLVGALSRSPECDVLAVDEAVGRVRSLLGHRDHLSMQDRADLVRAVQDLAVREAVWSMMTRADAEDHFALWLDVLQATPDDLMAPVGGLAAFAAWLTGRGVLASHGAERVLAVHPGYSMAVLLLELCAASVNPAVWTKLSSGRAVG
ncbi:MAG TPA: DUF4192 domain-containing protein [Nocardioidaceae bacterium]